MSPDKNTDATPHLAPPRESLGMRAREWIRQFPVRFVVIIVAALLLIGLIYFLSHNQPTQQRGRFGEAQPVGIAKVSRGAMPITLNALGTVTPLATVTVRPQVSGPVVKFNFTEGQMVKKGDVLAEIDPRPFQAALQQAQGQLDRDRATLANAKADLARYQNLWDQKAISQQQLATQRAAVKQDEGVLASDQGNVEAAALNLSYTKVVSPIDGRAGIRQVDVGNLVQAGQANGIVTVTQINPMSVLFSIPEDSVDRIMARMNGGASLQAEAYDRAQTKKLATGTLAAVDSTIDTTTGTVKLRAMFDNSNNALFPNQFVNIHLLIDTLENQTLVPTAAIQRGAQGTFVFIVNPDKTVAMRSVTTGATDGEHTVIAKGLRPGDTIVVDGADRLSDGSLIEIPAAPNANIAKPSEAPAGQAPPPANRVDRFQRMLKRLPPEEQEKLKKMTPAERRQWFQEHRGEFRRNRGG
jgi:multidrug efflux system membrane fusion protein